MGGVVTAHVFTLPDLGEGLTEAEIVRWLVADGDEIQIDQPVVEVETAKAVVEVPSPHAGRVATRHAAEGATLDVGAPLLTVTDPDEGSGNVLVGYGTKPGTAGSRRHRRPRVATAPAEAPVTGGAAPLVISPLVRRLARHSGVDLAAVQGTGPGGVITRRDVEAASAPVVPAPVAPVTTGERRVPLTGFRKAVAAVLSRSRAEIPEATVWVDVDATALWELRERTRGDQGSPGLLAYVARFVVAALREYPALNARIDTERQEIVELEAINLGLAVQTDRGLVVPAVMGAQTMTTAGLDAAIREVTARARRNESTPAELSAGTFTLNNYGAFRVDGSAAIINHPQVAILGLGRIIDRPWVVDGALAVRKITQLSFVFDHRVCDGGTAAGFMRSVADAMEDPLSALARL
ncbi:dihydrolipoamide acetyltransferase family protein [Actinoplanes aureus]|uniref:Dihydrolipoamide acetyltransferase component of pyruvate dehydrogenase complex n=1 Tax=Actinoplanes aureus TaxID=2792083 RepID=A0A931FYT1_9ACTN|nr:dihydrolipoamide acetyltransferase family protein [Actinoplanes aureus]MBG0562246.1 2-oxo acid dehydrogenase subunit E2 [Actinoplanes aureus]